MVQTLDEEARHSSAERATALLARVARLFAAKPFRHHAVFRGGHAQTLAAFAWPRRRKYKHVHDQERLFQTASDVKVLGHCRWQTEPQAHPTMVIWHGIEGSSASTYMLSTAEKAFAAGFNVIRMNLRTCGGTEHLTPTIYHGGLTDDLHAVIQELIERDHLTRISLVGFSLGGNMVLKLAGEYADNPPAAVVSVCAVSPSIDLQTSAALIKKRSNWLYQKDFVRRLKQRMRRKHELFPERYDISNLNSVRTLLEFDDQFTAPAHGFNGADDYYYRASSLRVVDRIRVPTLIIHAKDDPFIPFSPMLDPAITNNPYILLIGTERGGHVAFISAKSPRLAGVASRDEAAAEISPGEISRNELRSVRSALGDPDRFWAENRLIEFCQLADAAALND